MTAIHDDSSGLGNALGVPEAWRSAHGRSAGAGALERGLIRAWRRLLGDPGYALRLWDGTEFPPHSAPSAGTVVLRDRAALWRLVSRPGLNFGDSYASGRIEVEGDLVAVLAAHYRADMNRVGESWLYRAFTRGVQTNPNNTRARSRRAVYHHYDLGNDFYALWLDGEMAYTCAYYPRRDCDLDTAQIAKFDLVCRKLRLRPGERVVEAGCGWGGLARYMARTCGVSVRAYNVSHEQVRYARERAAAEGLAGRVEFIEDDYRSIDGRCDAFVSVGMMEHVGRANYAALGRVIDRVLEPHGRGLLHTIGQSQPRPMNEWLTTRIFPGGYMPTVFEIADLLQRPGFTIVDLENLRGHYALTCRHWLQRFDAHVDNVRARYGAAFVRAWRLYLAASIAAFDTGCIQLYQVLFTRPGVTDLPLTRGYMLPPRRDASG